MGHYSADIETTGLLEDLYTQESPRIHNFGAKCNDTGAEILFSQCPNVLNHKACDDIRDISRLQEWLDEGHTLVMHNGILYDGEALRYLGYTVNNVIIDSLFLAWYLEPRRMRYGLAEYGVDFGVPKPIVDDWQNLSQEQYNNRVMQDCRIQIKLWHKQVSMLKTLYGSMSNAQHVIDYLMQKAKHLRAAQRNPWLLNVEGAEEFSQARHADRVIRLQELAVALPKMPIVKERKRAAKPFKGSGELSSHGIKWALFCLEYDVDWASKEVHQFQDGEVDGNPNSSAQVKEWLFGLGWVPETYDYKRNEDGSERKIPQVNVKNSGGRLDPDVERMVEDFPELQYLQGLGIVNHRISIVDGWLKNHVNGKLTARCNGLTNTLRLKHKEIVNVPSVRVPYGAELRALLVAPEGHKSLGSDLSSLEDRCKHHYQMPLDPEYVKEQSKEGFDPHLLIATIAELITEAQSEAYKRECIAKDAAEENGVPFELTELSAALFKAIGKEIRPKGKATNYGCQYGAGIPNIQRSAKVTRDIAEKLHAAYWKANWSIKEIAASTDVKKAHGENWQWNPVSKIWYWLKSQKDRFSTLCQGTGSYVFDTWLEEIFQICEERWKQEPKVHGQFHDEVILNVKRNTEKIWAEVLQTAMNRANVKLTMNREMSCDTQFGNNYAEIH